MYLAMGYTIHGASITSATVYHMVGDVSMLVTGQECIKIR